MTRRAVLPAVATCLLAGPTALAFYSGGFFTEPRLVAAIAAWALVLALTVAGPAPLPRSPAGWLAVGGLVGIAAWSAISLAWAPLGGAAIQNVERLVLYLGALLLAIGTLRARGAVRAVEPALAAGATIVIGYGLAGRLLPGVLHFAHSQRAGGRLEQPITYWNAEGALAAVGLVLCARVAGDRSRPAWMRGLAGAATAPLGAGVYLSYSRGAIAAGVVGLMVLVAVAPTRSQLCAAALALATAVAAGGCAAAFPGVASLEGTHSARVRDGAVALAILALLAAATGLLAARRARSERRDAAGRDVLGHPRQLGAAAAIVLAGVTVGLVVGGLLEKGRPVGATAARLTQVSSNRYDYWRLGLRAFRRHPLDGLGSGGFRVFWLRERPITETVQEVHSLELEMVAELGLVGLLAFGLMVGGVVAAGRRALRAHPELAAGPCAAALVWFLHASIDWDWQIPAVSLPAVVLAGALVALAEGVSAGGRPPDRAAAAPPAPGAR